MPQLTEVPVGNLSRAQATELSRLVDLEACWENLRANGSPHTNAATAMKDLTVKQKAYDAFRISLAAYNKRFTPAHVPELLLNKPSRLGNWCRRMRDLFRQVEDNPQGQCPTHLLAKAQRLANQLAARLNTTYAPGAESPVTTGGVIRELETMMRWCDELLSIAPPEPQPALPLVAPRS
jgi:hypothetical protein